MRILILSRSEKLYSTRRLVEASLARGHDGKVVDYLQCSMVIEKGNPIIDYQGKVILHDGKPGHEEESHIRIDAAIPRIGASKTFYGAAVVRQLEMMKVFTTARSLAIVRSRDKLRSLQILARAGIGMPKTVFASRPVDLRSVIARVGGPPVVMKILEGTQGIGVVLAENEKAARSVFEAFHSLKANILIQEYIRESAGVDVRAFVVEGKVVASMRRQGTPGEFRSNLHRGGIAEAITLSPAEIATAIAAAKTVGLSVAGVDMLQSDRGPLVLEVNSSPGLEGIEETTGVNVADKIIRFIERNAYRKDLQKDRVGV